MEVNERAAKITEAVLAEARLIDACGQLCVDADSIRRGVVRGLAREATPEGERSREELEAALFLAEARLRNVPALTPFNDAEDAAWPLALARLQNTEPGPDQGIAMVGTDDLELALRRLSQFAQVALGNAAVIGQQEASLASLKGERDEAREIAKRVPELEFLAQSRAHELEIADGEIERLKAVVIELRNALVPEGYNDV